LFEGTLLGFEEEGFLLQEVKDIVDNLPVKGGVVWGSNQDVIHIDEYHIGVLQFEGSEDAIHYTLEGCRSVALTE
jgi:hypothetical protein